ncbi:hypothetical protein C8R44DRAFT_800321 [Mycena epipterygia]|nr:hypothetical protein C8R44DRAFT_800321 [Mycena epipterygia]
MSLPGPSIQDAQAPFSGVPDPDSNHRPSDFILRSEDDVDFHVHRESLKFASDFFNDMFAFPHTNDDPNAMRRDGKPVLPLAESAGVLYRLLSLAYPAKSVRPYALGEADLDGIATVYLAAQKYLFLDVQGLLKEMLKQPALVDAYPHRLFVIARLCDIADLARQAALSTLKSAVCPPDLAFPEMQLITAADLQKLYQLHHSCGKAAQTITARSAEPLLVDDIVEPGYLTLNPETDEPLVWWFAGSWHSADCGARDEEVDDGRYVQRAPAQWFQHHLTRVAPALRAIPTRQTVEAEIPNIATAERAVIDNCRLCSEDARRDLASFAHQLVTEIEASNNQIFNQIF